MNKKNIKIILILICITVIFYTIYKIITTYALFQSEAEGILQGDIADWKIIVNEDNISNGINQKFTINEVELGTEETIKNGKIAPGINGDFYITIIPQDTQVSIRYDLTIDTTTIEESNIEVTGIEEIMESNSLVRTDKYTYSGIIPLEKINQGITNKIKVSIQWKNNEENNEKDTEFGSVWNGKLDLPVTINVTQCANEELEVYEETGENNE